MLEALAKVVQDRYACLEYHGGEPGLVCGFALRYKLDSAQYRTVAMVFVRRNRIIVRHGGQTVTFYSSDPDLFNDLDRILRDRWRSFALTRGDSSELDFSKSPYCEGLRNAGIVYSPIVRMKLDQSPS